MKGIEELSAVYKTAYDGNIIKMPIFRFWRRIFPQHSYCTRRVITTGASSKRFFFLNLTSVGPCIDNIFAEYNQHDVTFHNFFISTRRSTCFRRVFRPSSGAHNCTHSGRYWSDKYLTLYMQFWAPDDGRKTRLKHAERLTEIKKLWNVAYCWLYSANSSKRLLMVANRNINAYHFSSTKERYRDWEWWLSLEDCASNMDLCLPRIFKSFSHGFSRF